MFFELLCHTGIFPTFAANPKHMYNGISKHVSIRKYKSAPIAQETLTRILEAGTRASTTGNMQVYSMVVTREQRIKDALSPCHFNQEMIKQAPVIITFCADFNRFSRWCRQRKAEPGYDNFLSFFTAAIDALLAAQNVCVAAESEGLGICYLGTTTYMADRIIEILELPRGVVPVTTISVGYPDEAPELSDRLPLDAVVHYEKYKDYGKDDIDRLYREKELIRENIGFVKENEKESLAQVFTDLRYKKEDNIHFSRALLNTLEKQGFMNQ